MAESVVLVAVEDDPDFQKLIRVTLSDDPRLRMAGDMPTTIDDAVEVARDLTPRLIVLDHRLQGEMVGLKGARKLKEASPDSKILLFTAYDLATEARKEKAIDAYLHKDQVEELLKTALRLVGLD
ncbi:MAG: response regulator [Actinomycetota bacterium]